MRERISAYSEKFVFWGLFLLIFLVPLALNPWGYVVAEPIKVFLLRFISLAIACAWLINILWTGRLTVRRTPLDIPLVIFLGVAALATLLSVSPRISFYGRLYRYEGFLTIANYIFIYYVTVNFVRGRRATNILLAGLLSSAALIAIFGTFQYFGYDFIGWDEALTNITRTFSTFGNAVFYGAYLTLVLPVALASFLLWIGSERVAGSFKASDVTVYVIPLVILFLVNLLATYSRGAWLGFAASLLFIVLFIGREVRIHRKIIVILVLVAVLTAVAYNVAPLLSKGKAVPSVLERIGSLVKLQKGSAATRLTVWKVSLRMIEERPLLGYGPDTYHLVFPGFRPINWYRVVEERAMPDRVHNDFLQVAVSMGLVALAAYIWVLSALLGRGISLLRESSDRPTRILAIGLVASLIGYLVQIMFSFSILSVAPVFWFIAGLIIILVRDEGIGNTRIVDIELGRNEMPGMVGVGAILVAVILLGFSLVTGMRTVIAENHLRQGVIYERAQAWDKAIAEMEKAKALNPAEDEYPIQLAKVYRLKFIESQNAVDGMHVAENLNAALELDPLNEQIYYLLGNLYQIAGQVVDKRMLQQAEFAFTKALELDPNNAGFRYELGVVYGLREDYQMAASFFSKAVQLNPKFSDAYYGLGLSYQHIDQVDKARDAFKKALKLNPEFAAAKEALKQLKD